MTGSGDHVRLWLDWCTATAVDPGRASWSDVQTFTADLPAAPATILRRLGAVRGFYARQARDLDAPASRRDRLWPADATPYDLSEALRCTVAFGWPEAARGRRDAVVLLAAAAGMTRRQIVALTPTDVDVWAWPSLRGTALPRARSTYRCPSCALTRWVRVLDLWTSGAIGFHAVEEQVSHSPSDDTLHDCALPLTDLTAWKHAPQLLCAVTPAGGMSFEAMNVRSVTAAVTSSRPEAAAPSDPVTTECAAAPGRTVTPSERAPALRDIDALLDQLDAAIDAQQEAMRTESG